MVTRIHKWGNSLGLRIPKLVAEELRLAEGTPVDLEARSGHLLVTAVRRKTYSLDGLLAGVSRSNIHGESEFGERVGREFW